ncbi:MAG: helix-turn-helix domain-containing protein [Polyangiales bacterium]
MAALRVVLVVFDGVQPVDLAGPATVFSIANEHQPGAYELWIASPKGGTVTSNAGMSVANTRAFEALPPTIDTVIVTGASDQGVFDAISDGAIGWWLRRKSRSVRRIGSVCTGAFVLASTGLLDGRAATTHWGSCALLQRLFSALKVEGDAVFTMDGPTFTSAGISAAIDVSLALVEADYGHRLAAAVARQMVVYLRRPGGQSQFSTALAAQSDGGSLRDLVPWIEEHLHRALSVSVLARRAAMSERNFARVFAREMGATPAVFIERLRVERAKTLLAESGKSHEQIAERCGFGSVDTLQRAMQRHAGVSPSQYRARFAATKRR